MKTLLFDEDDNMSMNSMHEQPLLRFTEDDFDDEDTVLDIQTSKKDYHSKDKKPTMFSEADDTWIKPHHLGNFDPLETSGKQDQTFERTKKYKKIFLRYTPRFIQYLLYSGGELNIIQIHTWAVFIGLFSGLLVVAYQKALQGLLELIWHKTPDALASAGVFKGRFAPYNYNWIVCLLMLTFGGMALKFFSKVMFLKGPSSVPDLCDKIHKRGYLSLNHVIPMTITSLITIVGGSSTGPEAAVLVIMAAIWGYLGRIVSQDVGCLRIITLTGMSAGLSGFFGLPLGGGIFVLEIPHRMGLQYSEAISTSILASIISAFVAKAVKNEDLGGKYNFPVSDALRPIHFLEAALIGILGAIIALLFTFVVHKLKHLKARYHPDPILLAFLGALAIGTLGALVPSSMFWSEEELQYVLTDLSDNQTFFSEGEFLPNARSPGIIESRNQPSEIVDFLLLAVAKFFAIAFSLVAEFPGGIIFPLFFLGAAIGQIVAMITSFNQTVCIIAMMGSLEAAITRTPWATAIILLQIHAPFSGSDSSKIPPNYWTATLSISAVAIFVALFLTRPFPFYPTQHSRTDFHLHPESFGTISFQNKSDEPIRKSFSEDHLNAILTPTSEEIQ